MPSYRIAGLPIDSSIALPAARVASGARRAWRFTVDRRSRVPAATWCHHEHEPNGRLWRSLARDGDRHLVRFSRRATFAVSFAERRIVAHPAATTGVDVVRQLLLGHVLPLVFENAGALAIHASAVRTPAGVLAFVSETRGGKSTIAAALCARGCSLVADDCAIVEVVDGDCRVRPMDVGLRLWPDTVRMFRKTDARRSAKVRVAPKALGIEVHDRPERLHRLYLLESAPPVESVTLDPVSRADAVVALLGASFHLGIDRPAQLRQSFENLSAVAAQVPVQRLRRPFDLTHIAAVVDKVLADAHDDPY